MSPAGKGREVKKERRQIVLSEKESADDFLSCYSSFLSCLWVLQRGRKRRRNGWEKERRRRREQQSGACITDDDRKQIGCLLLLLSLSGWTFQGWEKKKGKE